MQLCRFQRSHLITKYIQQNNAMLLQQCNEYFMLIIHTCVVIKPLVEVIDDKIMIPEENYTDDI